MRKNLIKDIRVRLILMMLMRSIFDGDKEETLLVSYPECDASEKTHQAFSKVLAKLEEEELSYESIPAYARELAFEHNIVEEHPSIHGTYRISDTGLKLMRTVLVNMIGW